jgi:hypothetical protein
MEYSPQFMSSSLNQGYLAGANLETESHRCPNCIKHVSIYTEACFLPSRRINKVPVEQAKMNITLKSAKSERRKPRNGRKLAP